MSEASMTARFVDIGWRGCSVTIEYQWLEPAQQTSREAPPLVVFLHEGLGSVAMWKDFPAAVCTAAGVRGLVYSRPGYGRSTPRPAGEALGVDFMHQQAHEVLPALLDALQVHQPAWLLGHSDGGSIALLHAARHPGRVAGLVVMAPHIFVEDLTVASIAQARSAWHETDLRARLSRYHDDVDSAFLGWNGIWLHPAFRRWNITDALAGIHCPVLAIQGLDDVYGTLAQIRGIAEGVPGAELLELPQCGPSPQRDQSARVRDAVTSVIHRWTRG